MGVILLPTAICILQWKSLRACGRPVLFRIYHISLIRPRCARPHFVSSFAIPHSIHPRRFAPRSLLASLVARRPIGLPLAALGCPALVWPAAGQHKPRCIAARPAAPSRSARERAHTLLSLLYLCSRVSVLPSLVRSAAGGLARARPPFAQSSSSSFPPPSPFLLPPSSLLPLLSSSFLSPRCSSHRRHFLLLAPAGSADWSGRPRPRPLDLLRNRRAARAILPSSSSSLLSPLSSSPARGGPVRALLWYLWRTGDAIPSCRRTRLRRQRGVQEELPSAVPYSHGAYTWPEGTHRCANHSAEGGSCPTPRPRGRIRLDRFLRRNSTSPIHRSSRGGVLNPSPLSSL